MHGGGRGSDVQWHRCVWAVVGALFLVGCSVPENTNAQGHPDESGSASNGSAAAGHEHVDAEDHRLELLEGLAEQRPEYEFPDEVPVIQWVTPEEQDALFERCMRDRGFPPGDNGAYSSLTQDEPLWISIYVCAGSYPLAERYVQPLNDAQIRLVYEYTRDVMIPCYNANGWPVDPASLPSEDTYVQTWGTTDPWIPPPSPESMDSDTVSTFGEVCPLMPPSEELYSDEVMN